MLQVSTIFIQKNKMNAPYVSGEKRKYSTKNKNKKFSTYFF